MKSFLLKHGFYILMLLILSIVCIRSQGQDKPGYIKVDSFHAKRLPWFTEKPISAPLQMDSIPFLYIGDGGGSSNPNLTIIWDTTIVANWFRIQGSLDQIYPQVTRYDSGHWVFKNDTVALELMHTEYMKLQDKYNAARKILLYMKPDGTITNWKKWKQAVNEYMKLVNN